MLEGVSPYIEESAFRGFLAMLGQSLAAGSEVAYDFKLPHVAAGFGAGGRTHRPYRLPDDRTQVAAQHAEYGLSLEHFETSPDLTSRLVPDAAGDSGPFFREDVLTRYTVG